MIYTPAGSISTRCGYLCYTTGVTSVANPVEGLTNLTPPEQLFCSLVASGWNYRLASEKAGWDRNYGWQKMQAPRIRETVKELALAAPEEALRVEITADLTMMRRRLAEGDIDSEERATMDLRLKVCMAHARFAGLIVDRKSVEKRSVDLSLVSVTDLHSHLGQALDMLEPGTRRAIEERVKEVKLKAGKKARARAGVTIDAAPAAAGDDDEG